MYKSFDKMCRFGKSGDVVTQLYHMEWYELLRKMDHDETWSGKRRSFGEINKMVIFRENVLKRDFLPFSTNIYFRENVLKEISYKGKFMGKKI